MMSNRTWAIIVGSVWSVCQVVLLPNAVLAQASPGPEHRILKEMEGNWDAVVRFGSSESKASAVYKMDCGGMWLINDFSGDMGGTPFRGHGIDGYDQVSGKFVSVWVDSMSSSIIHFEGSYDEKTKTLTLIGQGKGPDGQTAKFKSTTQIKDRDHLAFTMFTVGADDQATLMMTIDYLRKK